jgi:hypothetical protein
VEIHLINPDFSREWKLALSIRIRCQMMSNDSVNISRSNITGNFIQGDNSGNVSFQMSSSNPNVDVEKMAIEIQAILNRLSGNYPIDTIIGKMNLATEVVQQIENDVSLKQRILSSMKAGGTAAIGQFLNHPAASFIIAALEEWNSQSQNTNP